MTQVAAEEWITAIEKAKQGKRKSGKKGGTFALINHFGPRPRYSHVRVVGRVVGRVSHRSPERGGRHETVASVLAGGGRARRRRYGAPPLIFLFFCNFLKPGPDSPLQASTRASRAPSSPTCFPTPARKRYCAAFPLPLPLSAADQLMTLARRSARNTEDVDLVLA